jgi:transcription elongation factor Elf1
MLGEVKTGLELGKPDSRRYHKYIYHACIDCGAERWTTFDGGVIESLRCKACENRFKAKHNPALYKTGVGSGLTYEEKTWLKDPKYLEKQRLSRLGKPSGNKGKKHPLMGKHLSEISKGQRRSPTTEFKKGQFAKDKHPMWKGGITEENHLARGSVEFKEWRKAVFERDKYTCQECGDTKSYLHPHHIKEFAIYKELRYEVNNGLTLCKTCHLRLHGLLKEVMPGAVKQTDN